MRELTVECANVACNCVVMAPVRDTEAYCSDTCQNATQQSLESDFCSCSHPPCDEP